MQNRQGTQALPGFVSHTKVNMPKRHKKRRHQVCQELQELVVKCTPPTVPLVLKTPITVINEHTTVQAASLWSLALEMAYVQYYGEGCLDWTWDDMHEMDCAAMVELDEVLRAYRDPPLDANLVTAFKDPTWRQRFAPGQQETCKICDSKLDSSGFCADKTCIHSDWPQTVDRDALHAMTTQAAERHFGVAKRRDGARAILS